MANLVINFKPTLTGEKTDAQLEDQGYTYNQTGFTYNQAGVMYGGVFNTNQDVIPIVSLAENNFPTILGFSDIYTTVNPNPPGNSGMLIGMLGLTYP